MAKTLTPLDGSRVWPYKFFRAEKMRCRCGQCETLYISAAFMDKLELMRGTYYQAPMIVNSGCRCPAWNKHENGKDDSAHIADPEKNLITTAADIRIYNGTGRYNMIQAAIAVGINVIGIYRHFIHLEDSPEKEVSAWPGKY